MKGLNLEIFLLEYQPSEILEQVSEDEFKKILNIF